MKLSQSNTLFKHSAISAAILTSVAATQAYAAPQTFNFSVKTIEQVKVTERQQIAFATPLKLNATGKCGHKAMVVTTNDWDATQSFALPPTGSDAVVLEGNGCADIATANSSYGVYLVTGAAGTDVKVTLGDGTSFTGEGDDAKADTKFTFVPAGLVDAELKTTANGPGKALTSGKTETVALDASGNAGILVGGTITIGNESLTSGETLKGNFTLDVTY